jgi:ParB-like chromosome segregation protein Spo0J
MSGSDKPKRPAEHSGTIKTISDLKPDSKNARKHGERNIGMLERSLEQYGAGRSILVDEEGQIIAGHGVVEAASNVGIERVRPVEADGNEIIAVVRRGLSKKQKAELAIADNRTQELSEWDVDALKESDADLEKFFTSAELEALEDREAKVKELEIKPPPTMVWVLLGIPINSFGKVQKALKTLESRSDIVVKASRDENGQPQPAPED